MAVVAINELIVAGWGSAGAGYPLGTPISQSATLNQSADSLTYSEVVAGRRISALSMREWSGTISGFLPTPQAGYNGALTSSNNYVTNLISWSITFTRPVLDTTAIPNANRWRTSIPGNYVASGTWTAYVDDASGNPLVLAGANAPGGSDDDALFTLSTGNTIECDIYTTGLAYTGEINGLPTVTYNFEVSGTPTLTGANGIVDTAGLAIGAETLLLVTASAATDDSNFSGSAYWTSVSTTVSPDQLTPVEIAFQGTGALTIDPAGT